MGNEQVWNDESRSELRERLQRFISGELRLARHGRDEILRGCREIYLQDTAPEPEWDDFIHFATVEMERAAVRLASEQAAWPVETDCDRLDRVEAALRERDIVLWQVSPCCDTCTTAELSDRVVAIDQRHPGFCKRVRGYAFFIDQNMPEELSESTELTVYLGYGWFLPHDAEITQEDYANHSLGIAREVCDCLRDEGFEPNWNGKFDRKIGVTLTWQRRTPLE